MPCGGVRAIIPRHGHRIPPRQTQRPRIAVLGDMKELGPSSKEYHRLVARQVIDNGVEYVFLAGPEMKYAYEKLQELTGMKVWYGQTPSEWMSDLKKVLQKGGTLRH